jgi:5-methylcytosine-specific restriction endonuclease McrA
MIAYPVTNDELVNAINSESTTWFSRAYIDTLLARETQKYDSTKSYWGDIKQAFIKLQSSKCAYCEKPMAEGEKSNIDYDVEHHRPKSGCSPWPDAKTKKRLKIDYVLNQGRDRGYPELAFHPFNYIVACKVCNSPYKSDYFPLLGKPNENSFDPVELNQSEEPVIPMPLGTWGEDPSDFLDFEGFVAVAKSSDPKRRKRAEAFIDFFELNRRPDLLVGRAVLILLCYYALREVKDLDLAKNKTEAQGWVDDYCAPGTGYSAVAQAFVKLFAAKPKLAREYAQIAMVYVNRKSKRLGNALVQDGSKNRISMEDAIKAVQA